MYSNCTMYGMGCRRSRAYILGLQSTRGSRRVLRGSRRVLRGAVDGATFVVSNSWQQLFELKLFPTIPR